MSPGGCHTLGSWLNTRIATHGTKVAIDDSGVTITYAELERRSRELAARFTRAGYGPGDCIATLTGNSIEHVVVFFACAKTGLALVPLSWRLTATELGDNVKAARPRLFVVEDDLIGLAKDALDVASVDIPLAAFGTTGVEATVPTRPLAPGEIWPAQRAAQDDDPLLVIFTSGSEAKPKGAVLTQANCFWNNLAFASAFDIAADDVVLAMLPQFHVAAWNVQPLVAWWHGATVVLERSFVPSRVLQLIAEREITTMMGVPTQYQLLAAEPSFAAANVSSLRTAVVGGAAMPPELLQTWTDRGVRLTQGYGLTEASPNVFQLPPREADSHPGYAGQPYPYVDVRLVDPITGEVLVGSGTGELQVSGPSVFTGYIGDPAATEKAMDGPWLRTGDLAERDAEGWYRIVDRIKSIYISGGENVSPAEVEAALVRHGPIAEAAVVAIDDDVWGEVGVAFVVPELNCKLDVDEVLDHARKNLASFKIPRHVHILSELPRTAIGKMARTQLMETAMTFTKESRHDRC